MAISQTITWAGTFYLFPALLLRWEAAFGWHRAELTGAITVAILMSAAFAPVAGHLIDAGRGATLMGLATAAAGLAVACLPLVTSLTTFYLLWGLLGIALAGALYEPCFALITRARGIEAKKAITRVTLIAGFAGTVSFPVVHAISESLGWQSATWVFAAAVVLVAAPLSWFGATALESEARRARRTASTVLDVSGLPEPESAAPGAITRPDNSIIQPTSSTTSKLSGLTLADTLRATSFWHLALAFALLGLVHGVSLHHLMPLIIERGGGADLAVMIASFIGPMQVAGRLLMLALERRSNNHIIALCSFVILAMAILLLLLAGTRTSMLIAFVCLFGAGYGIVSIIRPVIARDMLGEKHFGKKSGVMAMLYLTASALGPWAGALLWNYSGYQSVLMVLMTLAVAGLALYVTARRGA